MGRRKKQGRKISKKNNPEHNDDAAPPEPLQDAVEETPAGDAVEETPAGDAQEDAPEETPADDAPEDQQYPEPLEDAVEETPAGGHSEENPVGELEFTEETQVQPNRKRKRGPTRMKDIAKDPNTRVRVDFNLAGEPYGAGSVKLSSYLGPLVREHVPITINSWSKITEEMKTVLWKSVQARFELEEDFQKVLVLKQMGCLWRSSKSRIVKQINEAKTNQQRMNLRPKNIHPMNWRKFVKDKTSQAFKVVSDSYKERRRNQIPHTCSRKGMVRLSEEMKSQSNDPSEVTRIKVWVKSRTKKDGTPVNTNAAEKIKKATEIVNTDSQSIPTNFGQDGLTQLLGVDNPGRMRVMGRNMTKTKLACLQIKHRCMTEMQEQQVHLQKKLNELEEEIGRMKFQRQEPEVGENSAARSVNKKSQPMCVLLEWDGTDAIVAEGRLISSDPEDLVNDTRLGPTDVKVLVEIATVPETFLWRPASKMSTIAEAVGHMIAWPATKCVNIEQRVLGDHITPLDPNKCKLLDLSSDDVVVAEGRCQTQEPDAVVNGNKLGPKAVKVFVDVIHQPETFIWRPTAEVAYLEDCLQSFVAWPAAKIVFESSTSGLKAPQQSASTHPTSAGKSAATGSQNHIPTSVASGSKSAATFSKPLAEKSIKTGPKSPVRKIQIASQSPLRRSPRTNGAEVIKENQKCKLMDISGRKRVVAEGRVHSTDPELKVHFVRLGSNAARFWVDVVKVNDAAVWRQSDEIEYMRDALGSSIAWPMDKLVIF